MKMKLLMLAGIIIFANPAIKAQTNDSVEIARTIDSTKIMAACKKLSRPTYSFISNDDGSLLCLKYRDRSKKGKWQNTGYLNMMRTNGWESMWARPFDYTTGRAYFSRHGLLVYDDNDLHVINPETGIEKWTAKLVTVFRNDSMDIILGYKSMTSAKLEAYRLSTGEHLWECKISHEKCWGWNNVLKTDATHLMVVADDICLLDISNGTLKTCEAKTGVDDVKSMLLQGLATVAGAVAGGMIAGGGYYYYPIYTGSNVITGLTSNIVSRDSCFYISDRTRMVCLNRDMQEKWSFDFPSKTASNAHLFSKGDKLYMINYGYGYKSGQGKVKSGRPFIASFDSRTGEKLTFNRLSANKDMVQGAVVSNDHAYLVFDDGMAYQALDDSVVNITPWDVAKYGKLYSTLPDTLYAYHRYDKNLTPICFDGKNCPVLTEKGKVLIVDERLKVMDEYQDENLYVPMFSSNDYVFVGGNNRNDDFWITHKLGLPVAHITIKDVQSIALCGNHVYILTPDSIACADKNTLLR